MNTPLPKPTRRRVIYTLLAMLGAGAMTGVFLFTVFHESPPVVPHPMENVIPLFAGLFIALGVAVVGFRRWVFQRKVVHRVLWIVVMLGSLVVLFYSEERWRGSRALAKLKREVAARGEKMDLASLAPPPVPDDQNFAMTPLLAWLNDYEFSTNLFWKPVRFRDEKEKEMGQKLFIPSLIMSNAATFQRWAANETTPLKLWRDHAKKSFPNAPVSSQPAADVLAILAKYDPELSELRGALGRPHTRFKWHYEDGWWVQLATFEAARTLMSVCLIVELRASALIELGRGDEAFEELKLFLRLAAAQRGEPMLMPSLQRLQFCIQPIWEGLAARVWTEPQLAMLQDELSRMDLMLERRNFVHGQSLMFINMFEAFDTMKIIWPFSTKDHELSNPTSERLGTTLFLAFYPTGWNYQSRVTCYRYFELFAPPAGDTARARWFLEPVFQPQSRRPQRTSDPFFSKFVEPKLVEIVGDAAQSFPYTQMCVNQAMIACALERHRLATGAFPETLDALVPRFLSVVPRDLNAQPLQYRRTENGQFVLYSTGWNGKDDGGKHEPTKRGQAYAVSDADDWAWRYAKE